MTDDEFIQANNGIPAPQQTYVLLYSDIDENFRIEGSDYWAALGPGARNWNMVGAGTKDEMLDMRNRALRSITR